MNFKRETGVPYTPRTLQVPVAFLMNIGMDHPTPSWEIAKLPSLHLVSGHHRLAIKTPFPWCLAGVPMIAYFLFRLGSRLTKISEQLQEKQHHCQESPPYVPIYVPRARNTCSIHKISNISKNEKITSLTVAKRHQFSGSMSCAIVTRRSRGSYLTSIVLTYI